MNLSQKYSLSPHLKFYNANDLYNFSGQSKYLSDKFVCKTLIDNKYYIINSVIKEFLSFFSSPIFFNSATTTFIKNFGLEENGTIIGRIKDFFESMLKRGIIEEVKDFENINLEENCFPSKYKIMTQIDERGFIGIDKTNDKEVFIKYYPEFHRRNDIEAWYNLLDKLDSKRIVKPVYEKTFHGYLVFDNISHPTLHDFLLTHSLNLSEKIIIVKNLVRLIADFHRNNIIHGDISETNILVNESLELFAIDLITIQDINEDILINSGTPDSLPPEKLSINSFDLILKKQNNFKSDIYQLGTLMYKVIYGSPPINCSTWNAQYYCKRNVRIKLNDKLPDGEVIPIKLRKIISKSLEIYPEKRFLDCNQINNQINEF